jgi:hypothetical protein
MFYHLCSLRASNLAGSENHSLKQTTKDLRESKGWTIAADVKSYPPPSGIKSSTNRPLLVYYCTLKAPTVCPSGKLKIIDELSTEVMRPGRQQI